MNEGIGSDRISDITPTILKPNLIAYTQAIAARHNIPLEPRPIYAGDFNVERLRWEDTEIRVPINPFTDQPFLFVPQRFLSSLPTLNADDWFDSYQNEQLRQDINYEIVTKVRLWRRHQSAVWLKKGEARPLWVFASTAGTALDESNVRKAFNQILDKAELHRRGPHQMRHTFGSLLINVGEPVTYVSRQLGHKDSSITLKVYARWLPDETRRRGVDRLDETQPSATPRNLRGKLQLAKSL